MNQNSLAGLRGMLAVENTRWTKSYNWLKNSLIWILLVNGMIMLAMSQASVLGLSSTASAGLDLLFQMFSGMCPVGAIILVHGSIISERDNGTLAWVLSMPVARRSVILSKLAVNIIYSSTILIFLQGVIAQAIIQYFSGESIAFTQFYAGVAQFALYIAIWVSYSIMLGVLLRGRSTVLGVALGTLFFHGTIAGLLAKVLPFTPRLMLSQILNSAVSTVMGGGASLEAILVALGWIACFILVSVINFEKEEL